MVSFMTGALCAACSSGVHDDRGRVACDGCDLPTGCCLCDPGPRRIERPQSSRLALPAPVRTAPSRLSERVLAEGCRPAPFAAPDTAMPASSLQGCRVVVADSAAVYAAALRGVGRRVALTQLPSLLPPAERCFVEMRGVDEAIPGWGAYLVLLDLRRSRVREAISAGGGRRRRADTGPPDARWLLLSGLVIDSDDDRPMGPVLLHRLYLDDMGALVPGPAGRGWFSTSMPRLETAAPDPDHEVFQERCTRRYFHPVAFALAFLNCERSSLEPVDEGGRGHGVEVERLRIQPFDDLVDAMAGVLGSRVEAARQIVPGRFEDDRRWPSGPAHGTEIRWRPERAL